MKLYFSRNLSRQINGKVMDTYLDTARSFSNKKILDQCIKKKIQNTQQKENQASPTISRKSTTFEYLTLPIKQITKQRKCNKTKESKHKFSN